MNLVNTPLLLIILDGFGVTEEKEGNAVELANMVNYKNFLKNYPHTFLEASGEYVGLPQGVMGNSEVGHMTIGAGRVPWQDIARIDKAIKDKTFFTHPLLLKVVENCKANNSRVHLFGLVSDGSVHSVNRHYLALIEFFAKAGLLKDRVIFHIITDGRDTDPKIAKIYIEELCNWMKKFDCGIVFSVTGRYYAMDRDKRWDRTKLFYDAITLGAGVKATTPQEAVELAYKRNETDEFIKPTVLFDGEESKKYTIKDGDSIICFNFRADRVRQITRALTEANFSEFKREIYRKVFYVTFTEYFPGQSLPCLFPPVTYKNVLGEVISNNNIRQFRIAETEKYAHITYFLNAGREEPFKGEERVLIPSQKVATYDLVPQMSAPLITRKLLETINTRAFPVYFVNYANPDMVGHTGNLEATVEALKYIDYILGVLVKTILSYNGTAIITADHGNCEQMIYYDTKTPYTAHTTNRVPFILINENSYLKNIKLQNNGGLANVAPTILKILNILPPSEFEAQPLF